jgi:signal transduction histidine kinase/CheY-like chemotaxis protein
MRFFRDLSIRWKLVFLIVVSVSLALLVPFVGFAVHEYSILRDSAVDNLHSQATTMAFNSTAVLSFNNAPAAQQLLDSLRSQPTIELACLYDGEGKVIAVYRPKGLSAIEPPPPQDNRYFFTSENTLDMFMRVMDGKEFVGTLYLRENVSRLSHQLYDTIKIAAFLLFCSWIAAGLLGIALQRVVSRPILELADTAVKISTVGDYSVRVDTDSRNEIGSLYGAFNNMLERVESSEKKLLAAHDALEERVLERTAQLREEIAQRQRTQADLERACEAAKAAARAKTEFLANMSHEIRTPITAILGYAEILQDEHRGQPGYNELAIISRNSHHLLGIINDILDISKIEAHCMSIEEIPCSIVQIMADIQSLMQVRASSKGLKFHVEFSTAIPQTVRTDPTRFRQILINLVANAVKFTSKGEVKLIVSFQGDEKSSVQCDIIDTGIGLKSEEINRLFQPFSQVDTSMTRRFGGTGLGLCISKRLAEMLGGDVLLVESRPEAGSHFRVTVAACPVENTPMLEVKNLASDEHLSSSQKAAEQPAELISLHGRILLAEDGPDNQDIITRLLNLIGLDVTVVENGMLAMEAVWAAAREGSPFDLILMDMQMPVMDGYEATSTLRREGYRGPIIALTAHAMSHDCDKCLAVGCNDYASKPIQRKVFFAILSKYLAAKGQPSVEVHT